MPQNLRDKNVCIPRDIIINNPSAIEINNYIQNFYNTIENQNEQIKKYLINSGYSEERVKNSEDIISEISELIYYTYYDVFKEIVVKDNKI